MNQKAEIERMQAAFNRAAEKATRGTREERSGRFEVRDGSRLPAVQSEIDRQLIVAFSEIERSHLMPGDFNASVKLMIKHSMLGLV
jgi:hypothetical protein